MSDFPDVIAYVDDDKIVRDIARKAVESARRGVLFTTFESGQDFINKISGIKPSLFYSIL